MITKEDEITICRVEIARLEKEVSELFPFDNDKVWYNQQIKLLKERLKELEDNG
jgi:hypothetical protein